MDDRMLTKRGWIPVDQKRFLYLDSDKLKRHKKTDKKYFIWAKTQLYILFKMLVLETKTNRKINVYVKYTQMKIFPLVLCRPIFEYHYNMTRKSVFSCFIAKNEFQIAVNCDADLFYCCIIFWIFCFYIFHGFW